MANCHLGTRCILSETESSCVSKPIQIQSPSVLVKVGASCKLIMVAEQLIPFLLLATFGKGQEPRSDVLSMFCAAMMYSITMAGKAL